jgi:hypothetical protein
LNHVLSNQNAQVRSEHPMLFKALLQLWEERPGWLLPDMQARIARAVPKEAFLKNALDAALCCLAYRFIQGTR